MIVMFCGHARLDDRAAVAAWLQKTVEGLIGEGAGTFYLGGRGEFDLLAARTVRAQQKEHPDVRSILVQASPSEAVDAALYDGALYPELERVPPRYCLVARNRWMVDASQAVVACVRHDWGGAASTLAYARRRKKRVLAFGEMEE